MRHSCDSLLDSLDSLLNIYSNIYIIYFFSPPSNFYFWLLIPLLLFHSFFFQISFLVMTFHPSTVRHPSLKQSLCFIICYKRRIWIYRQSVQHINWCYGTLQHLLTSLMYKKKLLHYFARYLFSPIDLWHTHLFIFF